jgi:hypothetical protein
MTNGPDRQQLAAAETYVLASLGRLNGRSWKDVAARLGIELKPRRKPRRPSLNAALRQATKAGASVTRAEVDKDGKVVLVFGEQEQQSPSALDGWLSKRRRGNAGET